MKKPLFIIADKKKRQIYLDILAKTVFIFAHSFRLGNPEQLSTFSVWVLLWTQLLIQKMSRFILSQAKSKIIQKVQM